MVGLRTQAPCLHGSTGSQIPQSATNNWGDMKTEEERQNQQKLLTKDREDNGKGDTPPSLFYSQMQSQFDTKVEEKKTLFHKTFMLLSIFPLCKLTAEELLVNMLKAKLSGWEADFFFLRNSNNHTVGFMFFKTSNHDCPYLLT